MRAAEAGRVHEVRDPVLQAVQHLGLLILRQATCRNGGVQLLLRRVDDRVDQTVDRLAVVLRDLSKTLSALELVTELRLGEPLVARCGMEGSEKTEVAETVVRPAD